jgi:hypothetical protein
MQINPTDTLVLTVKGHKAHPTKVDVKVPFAFVGHFETMTRTDLEAFVEAGNTVRALLDKVLLRVEGVGGKPFTDKEGNPIDDATALEVVKENTTTSGAARDTFWNATQTGKK